MYYFTNIFKSPFHDASLLLKPQRNPAKKIMTGGKADAVIAVLMN
jgi:hypothetical protein